jgi:hypothetical protein
MREKLEETKENIIKQKMDTLFQYISEEKSADLFEKQMNFFENNLELINKYTTQYNEMYFNEWKKNRIQEKQREIQEYLLKVQEYLEEDLIAEAVKVQVDNIAPASKKIQNYRYEIMQIEFDEKKEQWHLVQNETILSKIEVNHSTPPSVEIINKSNNSNRSDDDSVDAFFDKSVNKKSKPLWDSPSLKNPSLKTT